MAKFRKKPVEIEAFRLPRLRNATSFPSWLADAMDADTVHYLPEGSMTIRTLEGVMKGQPGDWIIQGVEGEIYPCKPDIFAATYEAVE